MTASENQTGTGAGGPGARVRGARYGEVLLVSGGPLRLEASVYNTLGLNDCPDDLWQALDAEAIAKQYGARQAILNGPRYFMMDSISLANPDREVFDFGGIGMHKLATVQIAPGSLRDGRNARPYVESAVARTTVYVFEAGKDVYELIAPDGTRYVMQSYSLAIDPKLTAADLPNLGARLNLPEGWRFRVRQPETDWVLRIDGEARVVQDDLENTYQRVEE